MTPEGMVNRPKKRNGASDLRWYKQNINVDCNVEISIGTIPTNYCY